MLEDSDVPPNCRGRVRSCIWPDHANEISLTLRFLGHLYDFWLSRVTKALIPKSNLVQINSHFAWHSCCIALFRWTRTIANG
jgi:hypothetical protein